MPLTGNSGALGAAGRARLLAGLAAGRGGSSAHTVRPTITVTARRSGEGFILTDRRIPAHRLIHRGQLTPGTHAEKFTASASDTDGTRRSRPSAPRPGCARGGAGVASKLFSSVA
jgi:hypothetical protein